MLVPLADLGGSSSGQEGLRRPGGRVPEQATSAGLFPSVSVATLLFIISFL